MIPKKVKLGDIADFINGVAFKESDWHDSGRKIIRIQNLNDQEKPFNLTNRQVSDKNLARAGDLLVSWAASLGVYKWSGEDACINQHIFKAIPNEKLIDKNYFFHILNASISKMEKKMHGATMKHITRGNFLEIEVPLPDITQQRRIAAILDKAEALRAKRREAIAKLDQLLQSVFLEMFGDPVKNEKNWQKNNILEYCDFLTGYPFKSANFVEKNLGIKICRGANVLPGYIDWSDEVNYPPESFEELNNFQLLDGDVIVAMDRPWISSGFKAVLLRGINEKILLVQRVARLRSKKKHYSSFIYKLICSQAFIQQCKPTETTIPHISPNDFRNFNIISPPEELIKKFHDFSEKIHSMKQKNENSLKKLDHFSASLQSNFFN